MQVFSQRLLVTEADFNMASKCSNYNVLPLSSHPILNDILSRLSICCIIWTNFNVHNMDTLIYHTAQEIAFWFHFQC